MDIGVLIGIVISVVIGVAIIPVVVDMMKTLDTANMSSATVGLINILPIVVVTMIIVGSVGYFVTGVGNGNKEEKKNEDNFKNVSDPIYGYSIPKDPMYFPVDKHEEEELKDPFPQIQLSKSMIDTISETKGSPKTSGAIKSFRQ